MPQTLMLKGLRHVKFLAQITIFFLSTLFRFSASYRNCALKSLVITRNLNHFTSDYSF